MKLFLIQSQVYTREIIYFIFLKKTVEEVFVPITLGGGIRSLEDIC